MKRIVLIVVLVLLVMAFIAPAASASGPPRSDGYWYCVSYGDSLARISYHTGVPVRQIVNANNIYNRNLIYAGQYLWIPQRHYDQGHGHGHGHQGGHQYHTVRWGQTLSGIGSYYGVNAWSIAKANGIYNLNHIYAGQVLYIPY